MSNSKPPMRPVGEVVENLDAQRLPVKASDRRPGPYPYYGAQGIVDYVDDYIFDGEFVLVAEDGENLRSRKEKIALIARGKFWVNNHAHIIRGNGQADTRYLYYAINATDISGYVTGSTIPKLSQGSLNRLAIPIPPIGEQRVIASILGALDDKIDLNRRMNETLEATARAIFKDWFVDFGPSRAKMEGHSAYLPPQLWELFPGRLDEADRPVGWRAEPLLGHARLLSGGTPRTTQAAYWNGTIPWASAKDVSQCPDAFLINTERSITERGLNESATQMIPARATVVVARGATTGRYCMFGRDMAMNQTCYGLVSTEGLPYFVNSAFGALVERLVHAAHGSVFDTITTTTFQRAQLIVGDAGLPRAFEAAVAPLFDYILSNTQETSTLVEIRDFLFPKLISGEIRVKDAEKMVEKVA
jgi:type I restriction enzyme S subunit